MKHIIKAHMEFSYNPNTTILGFISPNYHDKDEVFKFIFIQKPITSEFNCCTDVHDPSRFYLLDENELIPIKG